MLPAVPAVRPGRRVSYNESGWGDTQPPTPTFAGSGHLTDSRLGDAPFAPASHSRSGAGGRRIGNMTKWIPITAWLNGLSDIAVSDRS
jgi:hypothetical protein